VKTKHTYKAKSITGAQTRVRQLSKRVEELAAMVEILAEDRSILARLASKAPHFDRPVQAARAESIRNNVLFSHAWGLKREQRGGL
jgi:outer membrane murein-binding lipoprotein Lpp